MTTPDRTQDLLRQMLERRAGAPPPGWLLPSVADSVRQTRQVRRGPSWPGLPAMPRLGRLALIAAAAILLLALAAGVLVAAGIILPAPEPSPRAIVLAPSPSATAEPATPEPTEAPANRPPTVTPAPSAFAADSIAVVTNAGDGLRVRSNPNVGSGSEKYSPLLKKGSRMLVVDGPVSADGYDWYEVQPQDGPFGWVAAGKGGEDWIAPAEPECTDDLDETAVRTVDRIDFLVCYGNTPVDVRALQAQLIGPDTGAEPPCRYADASAPCRAMPKWLFEPLEVTPVANDQRGIYDVAARTAVRNQLHEMPNVASMRLTVAMDDARAADCRVVDSRGRDLIPRDEAITRCRMRLVITDVTWDPAMVLPRDDDVAKVLAADLPVFSSPGGDRFERGLVAGDEVLVVDDPDRVEEGMHWFSVIPRAGLGWPAGWVPFLIDDRPTLERVPVSCPAHQDWRAIADLDVAARLACFGSGEKLSFTVKVLSQPAGSNLGACNAYHALTQTSVPCVAHPRWLTSATGFYMIGAEGVEGSEFWVDPRKVDPSSVPATPTEMRLTGSYSHRDAWRCEVRDPESGKALIWDLAAQAFCRSHFVVTKMRLAP